ncbi:hypothetical protein N0V83_003172 [Neocucurbitaria cava]|uniref:Rhodopsin domain-containing protein n=1 Tax=Neocucurbitaria cava TaxID=798079 RepID=A0A9W8YBR6_9PLEO|nr:hypothetical protein N0V83_003172 [Neocucurbitaria cava]
MALNYTELMILIWVLWSIAFSSTALRGLSRWHSQHRLYADDYFVFFGLISLTGLSAVITCLLPQFFLASAYSRDAARDPMTPLPLPPDEFVERTRTSLKLIIHGIQLPDMQATVQILERNAPDDLHRADISIKFATSADVVADAIIMTLPLNLLRKLQITPSQKFGLAVIFSLGTIIIAFAFARLVQVTKATSNPNPLTLADGPVLLSMWSHIESSVSIIVATLPAFRYLLSSKAGRTRPGAYNSSSGGPRGGGGYYGGGSGGLQQSGSSVKSRAKRVLGASAWARSTGGGGDSAIRLPSNDERGRNGSNDWGSETELRPIGGIEKHVDYTVTRSG